ncbi:hypothetical protein CR513_51197, partial [Mucuna pruriens]
MMHPALPIYTRARIPYDAHYYDFLTELQIAFPNLLLCDFSLRCKLLQGDMVVELGYLRGQCQWDAPIELLDRTFDRSRNESIWPGLRSWAETLLMGRDQWFLQNELLIALRLFRLNCAYARIRLYKIEADMTRKRSSGSLYPLDPVIEKTLNRIRKTKKMHIEHTGDRIHSITETDNFEMKPAFSDNPLNEPDQMENNNNRMLKEMATPDVLYQPWCIQYPQLDPAQTYELKFGLVHLLPKFHGLVGEDPHKHLKEFHVVCSTMRLQGIQEDYIKIKAFVLPRWGSEGLAIPTAGYVHPMGRYEANFFPVSKTAAIRKEIYEIHQHSRETLHEYWEQFNKLCTTCSHDQISEQLLLQYFYERLLMMDRSMIDAASGGTLMDKTPMVARLLILNMASNTQQFGVRGGAGTSRNVSEVSTFDGQRLEN